MQIKNDEELEERIKELGSIFIIGPYMSMETISRRSELIEAIVDYEEEHCPSPIASIQDMIVFRKEQEIMSDEEKEKQRRSFVYGNCKLSNDNITREMVNEIADKMKG